MTYDNFLIDKRVVERNIKKGLVEEEALKRQIDSLPDRESNCVHVSFDGGAQASADDDLDDEDEDEDDEPADVEGDAEAED